MAFNNEEFECNKEIRKLLTKNAEEFDGLLIQLINQNQKMANHIHSIGDTELAEIKAPLEKMIECYREALVEITKVGVNVHPSVLADHRKHIAERALKIVNPA